MWNRCKENFLVRLFSFLRGKASDRSYISFLITYNNLSGNFSLGKLACGKKLQNSSNFLTFSHIILRNTYYLLPKDSPNLYITKSYATNTSSYRLVDRNSTFFYYEISYLNKKRKLNSAISFKLHCIAFSLHTIISFVHSILHFPRFILLLLTTILITLQKYKTDSRLYPRLFYLSQIKPILLTYAMNENKKEKVRDK